MLREFQEEFVSCVHIVIRLAVFAVTDRTRVTTCIRYPLANISLNKQLSLVCWLSTQITLLLGQYNALSTRTVKFLQTSIISPNLITKLTCYNFYPLFLLLISSNLIIVIFSCQVSNRSELIFCPHTKIICRFIVCLSKPIYPTDVQTNRKCLSYNRAIPLIQSLKFFVQKTFQEKIIYLEIRFHRWPYL